jgi:NAD(P)-dependent dehydrogenase (short-subunit alcohol dehydrogenase family)
MSGQKSIVVTGASSGFGAAFAHALSLDGHALFICARRADRLAEVAAGRPNIFYMPCDVSESAQVERFYREVGERTRYLDALIHCAGVLGPLGTFDAVESKDWLATITTNLMGAYLTTKQALPLMESRRRPRILILSGGGAFDPMPHVSAYGISKAATVRFVETLAVELKPRNIAVNAVAPGFAPTEIHRATMAAGRERAGEHFDKTAKLMSSWDNSMDVPVNCIRYMISDKSANLTGKTISARYDPWGEPEFDDHIDEIVASPLYATQRMMPDNLPASQLAKSLAAAAKRKHNRRENQTSTKIATPNSTVLIK